MAKVTAAKGGARPLSRVGDADLVERRRAQIVEAATRLVARQGFAKTVVRDIAVLVDEKVPAQALLDAIPAEKPAIVRSVRLFNLYRGAGLPGGKKSLAFRVVMQHTERTLTDAEADAARDALVALLGRKFSATLRR